MLQARKGAWWDANKVGLSPPLIETPRGWLMLYHGVRHTASGALYRLGLALFALDKPDVCLIRGDNWIFGPETHYERNGDVGNVAFPCGYTLGDDGDTINLYYGAADTSIALATGSVKQLLAWLDAQNAAQVGRPLGLQRAVTDEGLMTISTRRLLARSSGVALLAMGLPSPLPMAMSRLPSMPVETR